MESDPAFIAQQTAISRAQMPVTAKFAYFDHAAVAPLPKSSCTAIKQYADEASRNGDAIWLEWAKKTNQTRASCAELLQVDVQEIALVNSTTEGINLIAEGFPWQPGDNLLVPENEFPSNMLAWRNLERKGVEVRLVPVSQDGRVTPDIFRPLMDDRTRLISLSWVGFSSGFRVDLAQIVEMAHAHETRFGRTLVALDAIQGLGAIPINARLADVDFICADGHKWMLGPEGAGLFYLKREHLDLLTPLGLGWNSLAKASFEPMSGGDLAAELKNSAARYEGGTTNMAGMHGFGASLRLLLDAGLNAQHSPVENQILDNVERLEVQLVERGFEVLVPRERRNRSGILGVQWEAARSDPNLLSSARAFLLEEQVVTSVRGGRLRISTHAYNDPNDIDRLVDTLTDFKERQ